MCKRFLDTHLVNFTAEHPLSAHDFILITMAHDIHKIRYSQKLFRVNSLRLGCSGVICWQTLTMEAQNLHCDAWIIKCILANELVSKFHENFSLTLLSRISRYMHTYISDFHISTQTHLTNSICRLHTQFSLPIKLITYVLCNCNCNFTPPSHHSFMEVT